MDEGPELSDTNDPIFMSGSVKAGAEGLLASWREHEYWSDPLVPRQVLRECAATVDRIGALAGRITGGDPEVAEAARWLADLLAWHGRRQVDAERPPAPPVPAAVPTPVTGAPGR